jgi:cytochrome c peroxidase
MRYMLMFVLVGTTFIAHAQSVNNPQPEIAAVNSQPDSTLSPSGGNDLLGLPSVPIPANNPQTPAKIVLGDKLFHDKRFSVDGTVSCEKCHDDKLAFTDNLTVSVGHNGLTGTRNVPTVLNATFNKSQFWDGREPDLESQSKQLLINPVEHGLANYEPILEIIRKDPDYPAAFKSVFGASSEKVTIDHIAKAIASFERTLVSGNSPFDRYYFKGQTDAMTEAQIRGFNLFTGQDRCVSCHVIEQDQALFTDGRFHNIGVGINQIQQDVPRLAKAFLEAKNKGSNFDIMVLSDKKSSELGRFAVTDELNQIGAFKTPTLRNVELTAPYMHDGSLKTLKDVMNHYNNGGVTKAGDRVNDFLNGGIRPLNLTDAQLEDLVAFMKALTSPKYASPAPVEVAN